MKDEDKLMNIEEKQVSDPKEITNGNGKESLNGKDGSSSRHR